MTERIEEKTGLGTNLEKDSFVKRHKDAIVGGSMLLGVLPVHELIHGLTAKALGGEFNGTHFFPDNPDNVLGVYTDISNLGTPEQTLAYLAPHIVLGIISYVVFSKTMKTVKEIGSRPETGIDKILGFFAQTAVAIYCAPLAIGLAELSYEKAEIYGDLTRASLNILELANQYIPDIQVLTNYTAPGNYSLQITLIALTTALTVSNVLLAKSIEKITSLVKKAISSIRKRVSPKPHTLTPLPASSSPPQTLQKLV